MTIVNIPIEIDLWHAEKEPAVVALVTYDINEDAIVGARISIEDLTEQLLDGHSTIGPDREFRPNAAARRELKRYAEAFERSAAMIREALKNVE
jgi:hypothetical protein